MKKRVKKFMLGGQTMYVKYVNSLPEDEVGGYYSQQNTLFVRVKDANGLDICEDRINQSMIHEVVHAILDIHNENDLFYNEKFVDAVAQSIYQFIKTMR